MSLQVTNRPKSFDEMFGNQSTIESLKSVLGRENPPSTFLFTGPSGCGKTTMGRIVGNELGCSDSDFTEVNSSDDTGIDSIRRLRENLKYAPLNGDRKVVLLDECHSMSSSSQEALLKILEEPPSYVHLMLCTTNPEKLKPTLKRRCHQYELSLLKPPEVSQLIKKTLVSEGVDIKKFPKSVAEQIVELADGSAGQAMKLLDMVIDMSGAEKMLETLKGVSISVSAPEIKAICTLLLSQNMNNKTRWLRIKDLLKELKGDGESARRAILGYLNAVALNKDLESAESIMEMMSNFSSNYFDTGHCGLSMSCYLCCRD